MERRTRRTHARVWRVVSLITELAIRFSSGEHKQVLCARSQLPATTSTRQRERVRARVREVADSLVACSWIGVGGGNGWISLLDGRTGFVLNRWKGHESNVLRLSELHGSSKLISSSQDKHVCIWDVSSVHHRSTELYRGNSLAVHANTIIRGHADPVANFAVLGNGLLSASGAKLSIVPLHQEVRHRMRA